MMDLETFKGRERGLAEAYNIVTGEFERIARLSPAEGAVYDPEVVSKTASLNALHRVQGEIFDALLAHLKAKVEQMASNASEP